MSQVDAFVEKLENLELFKVEREYDLDYENHDDIIRFNKKKAYSFINSIICHVKNKKENKSFKSDASKLLNKSNSKDKKWLFEKLKKQIEYEEKLSLN